MDFYKKTFTIMPEFMQNRYSALKRKYQLWEWNKRGRSIPIPHPIKQDLIVQYKYKHNINILVESGTYYGDMVWAQRKNFDTIYSIELNRDLAEFARKKFKKQNHIEIIWGDSGSIMPSLVTKLNDRTLFWLDGHFSAGITSRGIKDCPIVEEIKAILSTNMEHIVLISNARCYTGERDYPTLDSLLKFILKSCPNSNIQIENDCIVVELQTNKEEEEDKIIDTDV